MPTDQGTGYEPKDERSTGMLLVIFLISYRLLNLVVTDVSLSNLRTDRFFGDQGGIILPLTL